MFRKTILDPMLSFININDIPNASNNACFIHFADDTTFSVSYINLETVHTKPCQETRHVSNRLKANKLKLNVNKTNIMLFQKRSLAHSLVPVSIDNIIVNRVQSTKFLGNVNVVDEHLNWNEHIFQVCTNLSKTCGILYRICH